MNFVKRLNLPSEDAEFNFIRSERRTCFNTMYPFRIFPEKQIKKIDFSDITVFYGGNGSGKTTLLNILAQKTDAIRHSEFNNSAFFKPYIDMCGIELYETPETIQILSSDDVFDYVLNVRYLNEGVDDRREQLFKGYANIHKKALVDDDFTRAHGLEDYDRWKDVNDALSKKVSQSKFVKERLAKNIDMFSNGETAMRYFTDHIDRDSVYLLDEPENSLSIDLQLQLAEYIYSSARYYNCQFVIATHSPILLSMKDALIYNLDAKPVQECKWTELDNVRKYFDFFMSHKNEFEKNI